MNPKPTFCPECGVWQCGYPPNGYEMVNHGTMICEDCKRRYELWLKNEDQKHLDNRNKES